MNLLSFSTLGRISLLIFRTAVRRKLGDYLCGSCKRCVRFESNFLKRWLLGFISFNSFHRGHRRVSKSSGPESLSLRDADDVTPPLLEEVFLHNKIPFPSFERCLESPEWFDEPSPPSLEGLCNFECELQIFTTVTLAPASLIFLPPEGAALGPIFDALGRHPAQGP